MSIIINGMEMPQNIGRNVTIYPDGRVAESSIDGEKTVGTAVETTDVCPVVGGKWEDGNSKCPVCGEDKFKGLDADVWADWKPPFCPNCGANMSETAIATNADSGMN